MEKYNNLNKVVYLFKGLVKSIYYLIKQDIRTVILYGDNPFIVNLFYCFFVSLQVDDLLEIEANFLWLKYENLNLKCSCMV